MLFGLGPWELAVTGGVILLVAGPAVLPRLGKSLGKSIKGLKEASETFGENLREEMEPGEAPKQITDVAENDDRPEIATKDPKHA